jgi:transcriptional regulator with XRE-family HTH domain
VPSALELFGKQIRALRLARHLSQEKLAEMCGTHRNFVGVIERADKAPGFNYVLKLSVGLKVRPAELFKLIPNLTSADIPESEKKKKNKKEK